jgi:hypothetical protein
MARARGRGRLSSIELLPEEASDIVMWAARQLSARERLQTEIYAEFRQKLIALQGEQGLAFDVPSFSAFNRYSIRLAALSRRLEETRQISSALAERLDGAGAEDLTVMVIETIKTLIFELLDEGAEAGFSPKQAMEMARSIQSLVAASTMSAAQRKRFEAELEAKTDAALEQVAKVATEAGLSADRIIQLKKDFLGVRPKAQPGAQG